MTEKEQPQAGGINPSASGAVLDEKEQVSSSETSEKKEPVVIVAQLPKPLQEIAPQVRGVVGPTPEEAVKANESHGPLEKELSTKEKIVSGAVTGLVAGTTIGTGAGTLIQEVPAAVEFAQTTPQKVDQKLAELGLQIGPKTAEASGDTRSNFQQVWDATDKDVAEGRANRSWLHGPAPIAVGEEPYAEAPGGKRFVYYYDKDRLEDNSYRVGEPPWNVTTGLLVRDLIEGKRQIGDGNFETRTPANVNVAGDENDPNGVTYAMLKDKLKTNAVVHPIFAKFNAETSGQKYGNDLFLTGLPITDPFEVNVKVAGVQKKVLVQVFERRVLTYTESNPEGWKVEMGNVGRHYYIWLYGRIPDATGGSIPTPTPEPTKTPEPTPTKTPESKYGLTAGDGWAIYNSRDASTSLVVMNRPGLDEIRKIIGPNSPSIELALFGSLEEAQQLYGVDPTRFTPLYAPGLNGGQVDIGKKFQFKDEKGNGIVALLVDKNKLSQTAGLNWVKLVYANLMLGTLFPAGENPERDTALRKTIINNTELQVN